ncbi:C-type lectin domain family 4 member E-like isoform X3 [Lates japonicus]|uniref:C-type lectin domain family 4 member E-like isoform X3 n=1 Tax=Lates japonicus TaxID=270547 RepID=A0AAD3MTJ0_LATJO|nr:C-type lectin domain family 4 member E-like isoform X3 [Lates japonicus]
MNDGVNLKIQERKIKLVKLLPLNKLYQRVKGHIRESGPAGSLCSDGSCCHCYLPSLRSSWEESRSFCKGRGGDLVKIDSREEQSEFLDDMGARRLDKGGS